MEKDLRRNWEFGNNLKLLEQRPPNLDNFQEFLTNQDAGEIAQIRQALAKIAERPKAPKEKTPKPEKSFNNQVWEPFNTEPAPNQRFINLYGGNFAQNMELNRKKAERLIQVAALEGIVILSSLSPSRTRSLEVNPDGTATGKRGLFWGEKPEDVENPYHRVTPIPEGWKIEICDQKIHQELAEKYSGEELQKKFVTRFNQHLRAGIWQAVWKEKLTSVKDEDIIRKYSVEGMMVGSAPIFALTGGYDIPDLGFIPGYFIAHGFISTIGKMRGNQLRTLNSWWNYFTPFVEIDRVIRGFSYLNLKGRNLVRLKDNS